MHLHLGYAVFLNYILHWGALRFYALLKGALTEKRLRKADLDNALFSYQTFYTFVPRALSVRGINTRDVKDIISGNFH